MFGWLSDDADRASRSNRFRRSGSADRPAGWTLSATSPPSRVSRARYTSPIPPAPSGASTSYGPSRDPAERLISGTWRQVDQDDIGILTVAVEEDRLAVRRDVEALHPKLGPEVRQLAQATRRHVEKPEVLLPQVPLHDDHALPVGQEAVPVPRVAHRRSLRHGNRLPVRSQTAEKDLGPALRCVGVQDDPPIGGP